MICVLVQRVIAFFFRRFGVFVSKRLCVCVFFFFKKKKVLCLFSAGFSFFVFFFAKDFVFLQEILFFFGGMFFKVFFFQVMVFFSKGGYFQEFLFQRGVFFCNKVFSCFFCQGFSFKCFHFKEAFFQGFFERFLCQEKFNFKKREDFKKKKSFLNKGYCVNFLLIWLFCSVRRKIYFDFFFQKIVFLVAVSLLRFFDK